MVRREIGMVAIEFEALALEDGSTGDVIAVEQAGKGRRRDVRALTAEVTGPGRAVIR
jgi:flagella basal body P-ring formation protein FlgA